MIFSSISHLSALISLSNILTKKGLLTRQYTFNLSKEAVNQFIATHDIKHEDEYEELLDDDDIQIQKKKK